jgi:hypothetical protein
MHLRFYSHPDRLGELWSQLDVVFGWDPVRGALQVVQPGVRWAVKGWMGRKGL